MGKERAGEGGRLFCKGTEHGAGRTRGWVLTEGRCLGPVPTLAGDGAAALAAGAEHCGKVRGREDMHPWLQDQQLLGETSRRKKSQDTLDAILCLGPGFGDWTVALRLPWSLGQR